MKKTVFHFPAGHFVFPNGGIDLHQPIEAILQEMESFCRSEDRRRKAALNRSGRSKKGAESSSPKAFRRRRKTQ